ncbi:MAG: calcium/sodium antiporter [Elusimicrobiota bacterium]
MITLVTFIAGIIMLWIGAGWFVKGSKGIAESMNISPLMIGLTLGAVGTSMPEFMVSTMAAASGMTDISLGNVIGSNMANIGLALGLGSLIFPVPVEKGVIKYDYWVLLSAGILLYLFSVNGTLGRSEGILFIILFICYFVFLAARHKFSTDKNPAAKKKYPILKCTVLFLSGAAGLTAGGKLIVMNAVKLAEVWGISEAVIGITVVAVGTSLPEIAVVITGALKKQPEISIGTIVGSNIINIFLISGVAASISPIVIKGSEIIFQAPAVVLFTVLLFPVIIDRMIKRYEGGLLFICYAVYIFMLF